MAPLAAISLTNAVRFSLTVLISPLIDPVVSTTNAMFTYLPVQSGAVVLSSVFDVSVASVVVVSSSAITVRLPKLLTVRHIAAKKHISFFFNFIFHYLPI